MVCVAGGICIGAHVEGALLHAGERTDGVEVELVEKLEQLLQAP